MALRRTFDNAVVPQSSGSLIRLAEGAEARLGANAPWTLTLRDEAASKLADEGRLELAKEYEEKTLRRRLSMKQSEHTHEDHSQPETASEVVEISMKTLGQAVPLLGADHETHFGGSGSASSSEQRNTSRTIHMSTITPPGSPLDRVFPSAVDKRLHTTEDWATSDEDSVDGDSSGKHRSPYSMSDTRFPESDITLAKAFTPPPSRPTSNAKPVRTKRDSWRPNNESTSNTAGTLPNSEISSHPSDEFFSELENHTHTLLNKYNGDPEGTTHKTVKLAILDTGVAMEPPEVEPEGLRNARGHIVPVKFPGQRLPPKQDGNGHGTHCAGILFKVCPYANIYVYRVSEGLDEGLDPKVVAAAIRHAVSKRKVDVICMPFGWKEDNSEELKEALEDAKALKVLTFAAALNMRERTTLPAKAGEFIAIDAATKEGNPLKFNPRTTGYQKDFTALGDQVLSAWPLFPDSESTSGCKRMSGTSTATAVAAATAALILEFARQPPLCLAPEIEQHLKQVRGMRHVLRSTVCKKKNLHSDFNHIDITTLLRVNRLQPDGGDWYNWRSLRMNAAREIVESLSNKFGLHLIDIWENKCDNYMKEHAEELSSIGEPSSGLILSRSPPPESPPPGAALSEALSSGAPSPRVSSPEPPPSEAVSSVVSLIFSSQTGGSVLITDTRYSKEDEASATQQLCEILCADETLVSLYTEAIQSKAIGAERFGRNFARLLRICSKELKKEAGESDEHHVGGFVGAKAREVAEEVKPRYTVGECLPGIGPKVTGSPHIQARNTRKEVSSASIQHENNCSNEHNISDEDESDEEDIPDEAADDVIKENKYQIPIQSKNF